MVQSYPASVPGRPCSRPAATVRARSVCSDPQLCRGTARLSSRATAVLPDPDMRQPMKPSTSSLRTGHLMIWLSVFVSPAARPLGAHARGIWTACHNLGRFLSRNVVGLRTKSKWFFATFLCRAGMFQRHGSAQGSASGRRSGYERLAMTARGRPARSRHGGCDTSSPCWRNSLVTASAFPMPISTASQPPGASSRAASTAIAR